MIDIDPILYIGISQSFFSGLLISRKNPASMADKIMSAWLFLICIELVFALLNKNLIEIYSFPFVAFTYGPLLYLYVRYIMNPGASFDTLNLLHFIPFVAFFTVSVIFRAQPLVRDLDTFFEPDSFISLRIIYSVSFFLSITFYSVLTFILIRNHQNNLRNLLSYTSNIITLNWLKIIAVSFYVAYWMLFILGGLEMIGNFISFDPYYIIFAFITLFSFVFGYYGIRQSMIREIRAGDNHRETDKYYKSGLKEDKAKEYLEKLLLYMEVNKPYLDPDLNIHELAGMTSIPRHYITQVLNENYKRNFFTFINEYRVSEVISRFDDPRYDNFTILAIAFDSGFNSKTTFNSIFKDITGMTPSQYRKEQGKGSSRQARTNLQNQ